MENIRKIHKTNKMFSYFSVEFFQSLLRMKTETHYTKCIAEKMKRKQFQNFVVGTILAIQVFFLWCLFATDSSTSTGSLTLDDLPEASEDFNSSDFLQHRGLTLLEDDEKYFTELENGWTCFRNGTDLLKSGSSCICQENFSGKDCGVPSAVWFASYAENPKQSPLKRRKYPRRIIQWIDLMDLQSCDFLEVLMEELEDSVDVYLISEPSGISTLIQKLAEGFLDKFQHKILYFSRSVNDTDDWVLENQLDKIANRRDDDLFLYLHPGEVPFRQVLTFLRIYDGYPEPVSFFLENYVPGSCTLSMLRQVYSMNPSELREPLWNQRFFQRYFDYRDRGHLLGDFNIGVLEHPAGRKLPE